jgi:hypothetical protein
MKERTIKITLDMKYRHEFLITLNDNGPEIRAAGSPVASRDSSIVTHIGVEPTVVDVLITVEEMP